MGITSGQLLDSVLSARTAKRCVTAGWIYSVTIALLLIFMVPAHDHDDQSPTDSCSVYTSTQYHIAAKATASISVLAIILAVIVIQGKTLQRLRKRLNNSIGPINTGQGMNGLYKRAMIKSALVAAVFIIGWGPFFIILIIPAWVKKDFMPNNAVLFFIAVGTFQGFGNAVIFRAKSIYLFIRNKLSHCHMPVRTEDANHGSFELHQIQG